MSCDSLYVLWRDEIPSLEDGFCSSALDNLNSSSRASAEADSGIFTRIFGQLSNAIDNLGRNIGCLHLLNHCEQRFGVYHFVDHFQVEFCEVSSDNLVLRFVLGISELDFHHESVELALRQGVNTLKVKRVLGCDHHERARERRRVALDSHLKFLHRLQKRTLNLGG